jgi:hypothetical protein
LDILAPATRSPNKIPLEKVPSPTAVAETTGTSSSSNTLEKVQEAAPVSESAAPNTDLGNSVSTEKSEALVISEPHMTETPPTQESGETATTTHEAATAAETTTALDSLKKETDSLLKEAESLIKEATPAAAPTEEATSSTASAAAAPKPVFGGMLIKAMVPLSPTAEMSSSEEDEPLKKGSSSSSTAKPLEKDPLEKGSSSSSKAKPLEKDFDQIVKETAAPKKRPASPAQPASSSSSQQPELPLKKGYGCKEAAFRDDEGKVHWLPEHQGQQWIRTGGLSWRRPFPFAQSNMVGVDWHNTLEKGNAVPAANLVALRRLLQHGFKIIILSFCGRRRAESFYEEVFRLDMCGEFNKIADCQERTGILGKAWLYKTWGVTHVFDDAADICQECLEKRLVVYPIQTYHERHEWASKEEIEVFTSFDWAVERLLSRYRK